MLSFTISGNTDFVFFRSGGGGFLNNCSSNLSQVVVPSTFDGGCLNVVFFCLFVLRFVCFLSKGE